MHSNSGDGDNDVCCMQTWNGHAVEDAIVTMSAMLVPQEPMHLRCCSNPVWVYLQLCNNSKTLRGRSYVHEWMIFAIRRMHPCMGSMALASYTMQQHA